MATPEPDELGCRLIDAATRLQSAIDTWDELDDRSRFTMALFEAIVSDPWLGLTPTQRTRARRLIHAYTQAALR